MSCWKNKKVCRVGAQYTGGLQSIVLQSLPGLSDTHTHTHTHTRKRGLGRGQTVWSFIKDIASI